MLLTASLYKPTRASDRFRASYPLHTNNILSTNACSLALARVRSVSEYTASFDDLLLILIRLFLTNKINFAETGSKKHYLTVLLFQGLKHNR